jgi:hypothetical protein
LIDDFPQDTYPNTTMSFAHSFNITITWLDDTCNSNMDNFCSVIPHHIKHLKIDVDSMNDMKIILNRLEHLSSVSFRFLNRDAHWKARLKKWILMRRNVTCHPDLDTLHIWIGQKRAEYQDT